MERNPQINILRRNRQNGQLIKLRLCPLTGLDLDSTAAGTVSKGACHSSLSHSRSEAPGLKCLQCGFLQRGFLVEGPSLCKNVELVWRS
ncbi:hypothetical protein PoB_004458300 [Plakobranchus ocellatus]|uniref:Uncharacterized protein n=1 Tax=Plakobranchus ocellatus TaxID=259542 RepID=A0AAV4BFZ9_9GAST|nr:hypothetical protein PoB_004458300 [Plakobranchus ocellatus]